LGGELRTVELNKSNQQFQFRQHIETGMANVHKRLAEGKFLMGRSLRHFASEAARILGDVNYVHPFREGNGRTQLFYLEQLSRRAGHALDLIGIDPERWIAASRASHEGDYTIMSAEIFRAGREK
jgi:cell filamentation protein